MPARPQPEPAAPASDLPPQLARDFAPRLVQWQRVHGRSQLPWQHTRDPYRVWLSEIMLQQTQVSTVLSYYPRFLDRFPSVADLAMADQDEVLGLWSGLGYYSRARHLHRCARAVVDEHGGAFPARAQALAELPGIGPSTAAAIASFCFGERVSILDGNVKRVLTRVLGFASDLSAAAAERELRACAQALVPQQSSDMPAYTQGLMDLGATVCLPRKPRCGDCPMQTLCAARQEGEPERYPVKSRRVRRSSEAHWLLWAVRGDGAVWLERRPERGVWGGLYCLPLFDSPEALAHDKPARLMRKAIALEPFVHVLTHRDLHLHPVHLPWTGEAPVSDQGAWFLPREWPVLGLPAPVRRLLEAMGPA